MPLGPHNAPLLPTGDLGGSLRSRFMNSPEAEAEAFCCKRAPVYAKLSVSLQFSATPGGTMGQTVELMDRITVNPQQCGGRPCVRGMRIRVIDVLDLLATGLTPERVVAELPDLELADVTACLRFASRRLDHPILAA